MVIGTFWCAVIGAFRSSLLLWQAAFVPPQVLFVADQLFCCLIVAVLALGTSILLSLLMLLEWKSYVNAFLDPKGVPFRVVINKLALVLNRNISCFHSSFFQITTLWQKQISNFAANISIYWIRIAALNHLLQVRSSTRWSTKFLAAIVILGWITNWVKNVIFYI